MIRQEVFYLRIIKENDIDEKQSYAKMYKDLFGNEHYKGLSLEAKAIYTLLRDRMEMSKVNKWITVDGEIYLLYKREVIAKLLEVSLPTITKAFKQLSQYGLIVEKRQGQGRSNIIFICHVKQSAQKQNILVSGTKESLHQDTKNICTNKTELSKPELSETKYNDNGIFSDEKNTCSIVYRIEVTQARKLFAKYYEQVYGKKYHKHKPAQNREIDERLSWAFSEYSLGIDNMEDMIIDYFNKVKCDHNLMHFTTEGIMSNRRYEVAY